MTRNSSRHEFGRHTPAIYSLLGITLGDLSEQEIDHWVKEKKGRGFQYVVTPNVDHLVRYADPVNKAFIDAYNAADLTVLDSRVIQLAVQFFHRTTLPLLPGSDLTGYLFNSGTLCNQRVAIIGGDDAAVTQVKAYYQLNSLSHYNPPMGFINNPDEISKCIQFVKTCQPEILFLAVGSPRQEVLAFKLKQEINFHCKAFCIGASIDFLIGKEKRAPAWMQKLGLEWFYRFLKDPKGKFGRYFVDGPKILTLIFRKNFLTIKQR